MTAPMLFVAALLALGQGPTVPETRDGQPVDVGYTKKILEYTTEKFFLTELVDYLPASSTVPTPEKVLGYAIGTPKVLTYSTDCARYLRELEKASKRIRVVSMGRSEEGREMVCAVISDEANLDRLDRLKEINALLGDPRKVQDAAAEALIKEGLPMYWATGGMHSPESGPPEMLMELAYRLIVTENPFIQTIRKNSIVMLTPVLETDGRDRVVDLNKYRNNNPGKSLPLVYWGKYVAHDNNRDGMVLSLALSKNIMKTWFDFHPTVFHDLHESVPYLYISTGTGPYNAWLDPITINEWQLMAYNEIQEMTKRGVPGVWTHDFFDGWAPNYGFYAANGHNAVGRFYETFGGGFADTGIRAVGAQTTRAWFRPNPPFPRVRWSIRNNTNIMQSALLLGMHKVAADKELFLRNYWLKSKRSVAKARTEGPAAYVFSGDEPRVANRAMLFRILRAQGVEISKLDEAAETTEGRFPAGSFVVRMDQPYSRMADMMLDSQYYSPNDPRSYDDCGWQLGPLFNLSVVRVKDTKILDVKSSPVAEIGSGETTAPLGGSFAVQPNGDVAMAQLRAWNPGASISVAEAGFQVGTQSYPAGTWVVSPGSAPMRWPDLMRTPFDGGTSPALQPMPAPRIALVHTWSSTQDEGWFRMAFDQLGIPYAYVSVHALRDTPNLREKYDCIVLPPSGGSAQSIVNGQPSDVGDPIPWKATPDYPNLGGPDSTDDTRGGIELQGVVNLQKFLKEGGVLICVGNMVRIPIDYGLVNGVSVATSDVNAPGGVYLTENAAKDHPVMAGYGETLGVYTNANRIPLLQLGGGGGGPGGGRGGATAPTRPSGRGSLTDPDVVQGRPPYTPQTREGDTPERFQGPPQAPGSRPTVLLRFAAKEKVLVSGMIDKPEELAGKPAVIHCQAGKGSVVLFGINPMWRCETVGSYMLLFNAAMRLPKN